MTSSSLSALSSPLSTSMTSSLYALLLPTQASSLPLSSPLFSHVSALPLLAPSLLGSLFFSLSLVSARSFSCGLSSLLLTLSSLLLSLCLVSLGLCRCWALFSRSMLSSLFVARPSLWPLSLLHLSLIASLLYSVVSRHLPRAMPLRLLAIGSVSVCGGGGWRGEDREAGRPRARGRKA
jgi:hypothetical protein